MDVVEQGVEPAGLLQLDPGGGGIFDTHLGHADVPGGVSGHLHHVRSKRKVC